MAESVLYFNEYEYRDSGGVSHCLFYNPQTGAWTVSGLNFTLSEIGVMFNIPNEDLVIMRLKYGA